MDIPVVVRIRVECAWCGHAEDDTYEFDMMTMETRPKEFEHTSQIAMEIASKWVDVMGKQALEGAEGDLFSKLAENWQWNLYITSPTGIRLATRLSLDPLAKQLYRRFVGEPFARLSRTRPTRQRTRVSTPTPLPDDMPPAWLLNEVMQRSLGVRAAR